MGGLVSCCCSTWTVLLINVLGASCISGLMMLVLQPGVTVAFFAILYCTFALFFGGTWPILYVVTPQAFPTISRGAGFGLASAFSKLGAISLPIFVGLLLDRSRLALGMLFTLAWGIALTAICFQSTQPRYLRDSAVPSSDDYGEEDEDGG